MTAVIEFYDCKIIFFSPYSLSLHKMWYPVVPNSPIVSDWALLDISHMKDLICNTKFTYLKIFGSTQF